MIDPQRKYRHKGEFVIREVEGEFLLIPINLDAVKLDTAFVLSATGAYIFGRLDGKCTVSEIADQLSEHFDVSKKEALSDTKAFIQKIADQFLE